MLTEENRYTVPLWKSGKDMVEAIGEVAGLTCGRLARAVTLCSVLFYASSYCIPDLLRFSAGLPGR